jgi:serine/threonine protein kinase/WD40 repeat protein
MADRLGQQLGLYRLNRLVGKGAFAEVYLAEHVRLLTQAAVKVLQAQLEREEEERFQEEARTLARLTHPHIIHLEDFAVHDGTPFLVMDYAPNGTLRQKFPKGVAQPPGEILPYVWQVAEALQFAHGLQVIHRDVKPENMLLDANNEVLLSDFGIAVVSQNARYKAAQEAIGTATYMAPEQVRARAVPVSDEYSLAVLVYEWLCGAPPFQGSVTEVMAKHLFAEPPRMRERVRTISPAIEAVIMGALSKDPEDRFPSVQSFAEAFDQACQAVPMLLFAAPSVVAQVEEMPAPAPEPPPPAPAAPAEPQPPVEPPAPLPEPVAYVPTRRGRFASAPVPTPATEPPAPPERQATPPPMPVVEMPAPPAASAPPPMPPTNAPAAPEPPITRSRSEATRPVPDVQKMLDLLPDPPISLQQAEPPPPPAWPAPGSGPSLAPHAGTFAGGARPMPPAGQPHRPAFSGEPPAWGQAPTQPPPAPAAAGEPPLMPIAPVRPPADYQGASIVLSAPAGQPPAMQPPATQPPPAAALLPSFSNQPGQPAAPPNAGGEAAAAQARNALGPTWREVNWIPTPSAPISAPSSLPLPELPSKGISRRNLLIGGAVGLVVVGGLAWLGINELTRPTPATNTKTGVTPSPASPTPIPQGTTLYTYNGHTAFVRGLVWSPDGSRIASASDDKTVQVWGALDGSQPLTYAEHTREVLSVAWSPDGQYIASGSRDLSLHVWNATTGERLHAFGFNGRVMAVAWSPDGTHLAAGSWDGTVQIWDTSTWLRIHRFTASGEVNALSWSPDNIHLVTGDNARQAVIWNGIDGGRVLTYRNHTSTILSVAWSPDGTKIVSGADADDTTVQCWDSTSGDRIWNVLVPDETPALAWSVKGDQLAAGGRSATMLDPQTGSQVFSYPGETSTLAWSPDGTYIASGGEAMQVQVWQAT